MSHVERRRLLFALRQVDDDQWVPLDAAFGVGTIDEGSMVDDSTSGGAFGSDEPAGVVEDDRRRRTRRAFHQHLPKLADENLVEWDRDAHRLRRGNRFADVEPLLSLLETSQSDLSYDVR